jgi:predicted TIM-barrel fold metal-dependent hydrolase
VPEVQPVTIDVHAHVFPRPVLDRLEALGVGLVTPSGQPMREVPRFWDPDARLAELDAARLGFQVLSLGPPGFDRAEAGDSVDLARLYNDALAGIVAAAPRRFAGFAALPLQDPRAAVKELERGVKDLGLVGAQVFTNTRGRFLDAEEYWPIYEAAESLEAPLFVHPTTPACVTGLEGVLSLPVGFLLDTTVTASRLVVNGVLDRFPRLQVVLAHLGATLPYILPRIDILTAGRTALPRPLGEYFRRFYLDTVSHHGPAYRCALETWGAERILLGSDFPYARWEDSVAAIEGLGLPPATTAAICGGNARALLRRLPDGV